MQTRTALIGILVFLIASGLFVWGYFIFIPNTSETSTVTPSTASNPASNPVVQKDPTSLPILVSDPQVLAASLTYIFEGTLQDIRQTTEGKELITDITTKNKPRFLITKGTRINFYDQSLTAPANQNDLKPNQKIRIVAVYGLKINKWDIARVIILVPELPTQTPPKPQQ